MNKFYYRIATLKNGDKKFVNVDANSGGYEYLSDNLATILFTPQDVTLDRYLANQGAVKVECIEVDPGKMTMQVI